MKPFLRPILAILMVSCLLVACVIQPRTALTPKEATRLADIKARSSGYDLQDYERAPATYDESDESWWTSYVQKGTKYVEFNVCVYSKTREAWVVLR